MVDTVQPQGLLRFEPIGVVATEEDEAAEMEQPKPNPGQDTSVFYGERGWMARTYPRLRRREKNVLDIPLYRSGHYTSLRRLFALQRSGVLRRGG